MNAIRQAEADTEVHATIILCAGRTFIAGADVSEFDQPPQEPHLPAVTQAIENALKPVVVALHGTALGGGFEIALAVHQFCRIGRNAMVGLSSKVVQDALPFCITDGNPGRARGLNLVGLKRNGFSREDISALKEAYRMLYSRVPEEALARMAAMNSPPVSELSAFIANSKRGFAHPTR